MSSFSREDNSENGDAFGLFGRRRGAASSTPPVCLSHSLFLSQPPPPTLPFSPSQFFSKMAREQATAAARSSVLEAPLLENPSSSSSAAFAAVGDSLRETAPPPLRGLDRAVVVTGVSRGIGAAIARCLTAKGYHVFGTVRKAADAEKLLERLQGSGESGSSGGRGDAAGAFFTPLVLDVCDAAAVSAAASRVAATLGPRRTLAGLVNNAGIHVGSDPVALLPPDLLRRQLEVNLVAPLVVTQAFLPLLGTDRSRDLGKPGRIFMMSSVYGCYGVPWNVSLVWLLRREGREREKRVFMFFLSTSTPAREKEKKEKVSPLLFPTQNPKPTPSREPTLPPSSASKGSPRSSAARSASSASASRL